MVWSALLIPLALVSQQAGGRGGAIGPVRTVLTLEATLVAPVHSPDGRVQGLSARIPAGTTTGEPWFVYSRGNLCESYITRTAPPADATDGWRVSIVEKSNANAQLILAVTWVRQWERGRPVPSPSSGTVELTLKGGDRIPLDQITRTAVPDACAATRKTLELHVGGRSTPPLINVVSGPAPTEPDAPLDAPVATEIWLVHKSPNGTEKVERQVVRLTAGGTGFIFRGLPFDSSDGPMVVEVTGQLRAVLRADGTRGLWTGFSRTITHQASGRTYTGTAAGKTENWPAAGDVFSFDLPEPMVFAGGASGGAVGGMARTGAASGGGATAGGTGGSTRVMTGAASSRTGGGAGGGGSVSEIRAQRGPNILEGHQLSVRIKLVEAK